MRSFFRGGQQAPRQPAIGVPLLRGESRTLATTSAIAFGAIDAGYVAVSRISPIYLCDAAAQAGFLALGAARRP